VENEVKMNEVLENLMERYSSGELTVAGKDIDKFI
jgi:hypothetical protein